VIGIMLHASSGNATPAAVGVDMPGRLGPPAVVRRRHVCGSSKLTGIALLSMTVRDHCGQPGEAAEPETAAGLGIGAAR
jgi:hypothetical protein